jgi:hypothetical protein
MDSVQIPTHLQADGTVYDKFIGKENLMIVSVCVIGPVLVLCPFIVAANLTFLMPEIALVIAAVLFSVATLGVLSYAIISVIDKLDDAYRHKEHISKYTGHLNHMIELFNSDVQNPPENKDMLNTTVRTLVKRNSSFFEIFTCILPLLVDCNNSKNRPQTIAIIKNMIRYGFTEEVLALMESNSHTLYIHEVYDLIPETTYDTISGEISNRIVALLFTPFKHAESDSTKMPIELLLATTGKPITPLDIQLAKETLSNAKDANSLLGNLMNKKMTHMPILEFIAIHNKEARSSIIEDIQNKTTNESYQRAMTSCADGSPILTNLFGLVDTQGKWDIVNQIKKYADEGCVISAFDLDRLLRESDSIPEIQNFINRMKELLNANIWR